MGCCISRASGPNSPYPSGGPTGRDPSSSAGPSPRLTAHPGPAPLDASLSLQNPQQLPHQHPQHHAHHHHHQHPTPTNRTSTIPPGAVSGVYDPTEPGQIPRARRRSHRPLTERINHRLRRTVWTSPPQRIWTTGLLAREREAFFDTRVTGRAEIWGALRAAVEELQAAERSARNAGTSVAATSSTPPGAAGPATSEIIPVGGSELVLAAETRRAEALATAQSILDAAEVLLPTGDLANGAYDALGEYYALHDWVVADPTNVVVDDRVPGGDVDDDDDKGVVPGGVEEDEGDDDTVDEGGEYDEADEARRLREEKGKVAAASVVIDPRDAVVVRARLSENGRDVTVTISKDDSIKVLARRVAEEAQLPKTKVVRIAYMGRILKDPVKLTQAYGWKSGHVVNALVFDR